MLKGRKVVMGITGGIAAYKAAELTRALVKKDAHVRVIMTRNAMEFITPLTMQTLSGNPVCSEIFLPPQDFEMAHIYLSDFADILVIAPATANIIGKIASGIADDLLTTTVMAAKAPVLICPAMNVNMLANAAVQENMAKLAAWGYHLLEPVYGELACKAEGAGRLPDIPEIVEEVETILTVKDLAGERVLVTAGPTREPLDPVRFITNYSSGKMGYALAIMAKRRGASVTLISGPTLLPILRGVRFIGVSTACEMKEAVMANYRVATAIIKAAAAADYRPAVRSDVKIKKQTGAFSLSLERNPDIIEEIGKVKGDRLLIGFAMESENLMKNAAEKMVKKNMDYIVANMITAAGGGFQSDTNVVTIIGRNGEVEELPRMDKLQVADKILDKINAPRGN
ncbi:MAG: bifunctional phosphopantothenoylcysteine decarboxylase/phosphopantothenate--cysteine ligase CoaBC [Syntrophobacteraceae bacterium CG23_combo_of_CG06-09_8_20_14_all_50_8]|nr:MAG: bifunctional phosphopantothenoylcysteine decarboxylase/phosphopantothenate--cysteine ligase CoaBC [Syntrophobacteraceae bacterium CG23_combo_of_CG06-09_8_20_14_all_50_8]